MRKIVASLSLAIVFACSPTEKESTTTNENSNEVSYTAYGADITPEGTITAEELVAKMKNQDSLNVKITGIIDEVCQMKGCWMDIKAGEDEYIAVKFKDYGFFMPKDAAGREVILEGIAFVDTVSVEELKHFAQDAEEPDSVINAITEPEINIGFIASGVLIKEENEIKE